MGVLQVRCTTCCPLFHRLLVRHSWNVKPVVRKIKKFLKVDFFFRKCDVFVKSPKKNSKSLSWTWNLNFPPTTVNNLFGLQVNLFQKHLFLHQLTHNMTKDCSLNYEFSTWKLQAYYMLCAYIVLNVKTKTKNNLCTQ